MTFVAQRCHQKKTNFQRSFAKTWFPKSPQSEWTPSPPPDFHSCKCIEINHCGSLIVSSPVFTTVHKCPKFAFISGPLSFYENSDTQCATTCPDTQKFAFAPGTTYEYRYESDVTTSIPGATEESSALHVTATARVETLSNCEMALVVSPRGTTSAQPCSRAQAFKADPRTDSEMFLWQSLISEPDITSHLHLTRQSAELH